jgi:signal transduction histidine kinase
MEDTQTDRFSMTHLRSLRMVGTLKIRSRIVLLVVILLGLMISAEIYSMRSMSRVGREVGHVAIVEIPLTEAVTRISNFQLKQALSLERAFRYSSPSFSGDQNNPVPLDEATAQFDNFDEDIRSTFGKMEGSLRTHVQETPDLEQEDLFREISDGLDGIRNSYTGYHSQGRKVLSLLRDGRHEEAKQLLSTSSLEVDEARLRERVESILHLIQEITLTTARRATELQSHTLFSLLVFSVVALFLGVALAVLITLSITRPLSAAVEVAEKMAAGDRNVKIPKSERAEIGQLLAAMQKMLQAVKASELALEERNAELARSNSELEQFAYVASHDLQEPLRMVASYMQLLEKRYKGRLDEKADEFIHYAVDGVVRMKRLINDLLEYSRVGRREIKKERADLNEVFRKAILNLQEAIREKGGRVEAQKLPIVVGDEIQLVQLFQNLIGNALKFCKERTPDIQVRCLDTDDEWQITFRDNGIGMEQDSQNKIFQVFQRLHSTKEYPGTGIGLAICKRIVERHGGRIWAESQSGQGSTFFATLPKVNVDAPS